MCDVYAGSLLASFHRDDPAHERVAGLIGES
jgi:hypothetical protein